MLDKDSGLSADLWGHPEYTDTTAKQRVGFLSSPGVGSVTHQHKEHFS